MSASGPDSDSIDETPEIFRYQSSLANATPTRFRLIRIQKADSLHHPVHIELEEYDFDDRCPEYETLSYVWGDASDRTSIWCNELQLSITTSLDLALRYLRDLSDRPVWIDQICINQEDGNEKGFQVGHMRDIYQRSVRTLAWLGPEDQALGTTFSVFARLATSYGDQLVSDASADDTKGTKKSILDDLIESSRNPEKVYGTSAPENSQVKEINRALSNTWFTRIWIVQEIAVSAQLILITGLREMSFDEFAFGMLVFQSMNIEERSNVRVNAGQANITNLIRIRGAHQKRNDDLRRRQLRLPQLLAQCCRFNATDVRDRFFALYGLTSTNLVDASIAPDYSTDSTEVLCLTVANILRQDKCLRLLELAECKNDVNLPSWIPGPRSSSDPRLLPLSKLLTSDNEGVTGFLDAFQNFYGSHLDAKYEGFDWNAYEEATFAAERQKSERAELLTAQLTKLHDIETENLTKLCLKGQLIDRIDEVSPIVLLPADLNFGYGCAERDLIDFSARLDEVMDDCEDSFLEVAKASYRMFGIVKDFATANLSEWRDFNNAVIKMDRMVFNRASSAYPTQEKLLQAYRDTVCAGQFNLAPDGEAYPTVPSVLTDMSEADAMAAFNGWRTKINGGVRIDKFKSKFGFTGRAGYGSLLSTSLVSHATYDIWHKLMLGTALTPLFGRRLAWTAKGRLALVPAKTSPGDFVFHLNGSDVPFVLRSRNGPFQLLGPSFLDDQLQRGTADVDSVGIIKLI